MILKLGFGSAARSYWVVYPRPCQVASAATNGVNTSLCARLSGASIQKRSNGIHAAEIMMSLISTGGSVESLEWSSARDWASLDAVATPELSTYPPSTKLMRRVWAVAPRFL